jgi:hypothetical protein
LAGQVLAKTPAFRFTQSPGALQVGGLLDRVLSLVMDGIYSFPGLILAIAMAALLGPGMLNVAIAIAVICIPVYFCLVRSSVLGVIHEEYVTAARLVGDGPRDGGVCHGGAIGGRWPSGCAGSKASDSRRAFGESGQRSLSGLAVIRRLLY